MAHDEARLAAEEKMREVFAPAPLLDKDGKEVARVCKRGRAVRIYRIAAERADASGAVKRVMANALAEAEQDYLETLAEAKRLASEYRAQAGADFQPLKVPRCDCGYCVGYRPYDDLLAAEHSLRMKLVNLLVPADGTAPDITMDKVAEVQKHVQVYVEICNEQGEAPRWSDVFFGDW